jgi:diguanylate cyclase
VAVKDNKIAGAEALLRWQHPESGIVSPLDFIPLAEETGLIVPLGEWVIRTACLQNKEWQKRGFEPMSIAVNLSNRQFEQPNLLEIIIRTLKEIDMATKYVELEITESTLMKNPDSAISILNELKDIGITISIDDFGTGYSSLEYLKRISLNSLKVAYPFIKNILSNADDAAITKTIITLAHNMNLKVIAEGVETEQQLEFLKKLGCDEVQGYFFSRPLPADEFIKLLQKGYF